MTEQQARTTANILLSAAVVGAVAIVLRSPSLRRLVWRMARDYAKGPLPVVAATAVRTAWDESGRARRAAGRAAPGSAV